MEIKINIKDELVTDEVRAFAEECGEMINLYAKKNHDYGDSFSKGMNDLGLNYGVGRLYDKMNRIVNFLHTTFEITDEKFTDTVRDLACYSVMLRAYIDKQDTNSSTGVK